MSVHIHIHDSSREVWEKLGEKSEQTSEHVLHQLLARGSISVHIHAKQVLARSRGTQRDDARKRCACAMCRVNRGASA